MMKLSRTVGPVTALILAAPFLFSSARADEAMNRHCDELAASGLDVDRLPGIEGIDRGDIVAATAIPACEAALAADPDNAHIMFNLARVLDATDTDQVRATQLYQQAADKGSIVGMVNIGRAYELGNGVAVDLQKAVQWTQAAADKGLAMAQNNVGNYYLDGEGVARDFAAARSWFEKAQAQGYALATTNLGYMAEMGWGEPQNLAKGASLYQKAVDAGDSLAMSNLGYLYDEGLGVPQDFAKARKLYEDAIEAGETRALNGLGYLYDRGLAGLPLDHAKANEYYRQAMDAGDIQGMSNLGQSMVAGEGMAADVAGGIDLLLKAEAEKNSDAAEALAKIYSNGKHVSIDLPKAADHYLTALGFGSHPVTDLLITRRAMSLSPALIDQLQTALKARGKTFTQQSGNLSDSAIAALQDISSGR